MNHKSDIHALASTIEDAISVVILSDEQSDTKDQSYTQELINLVNECHADNPEERPAIYELWNYTRGKAQEWRTGGQEGITGKVLIEQHLPPTELPL